MKGQHQATTQGVPPWNSQNDSIDRLASSTVRFGICQPSHFCFAILQQQNQCHT